MRYKIIFTCFCIIYLSFSSIQAKEIDKTPNSYEVFNLGLAKCEKVVNTFDKVESVEIGLKLWLGGYFTAMNSLSTEHSGITAGKDINEITEAVINKCKLRPMLRIADVTSGIMPEFSRQKSKEPEKTKGSVNLISLP